jgi:general secretion pathway protein M
MIAAWWQQQSARDRRVLVIGGIIVAIFLVWSFIWHPLASEQARLGQQLDNARRDLAFVRVAEAEVERLRNAGVRSRADRQGKSLLALADVSARGAGLKACSSASNRLAPTACVPVSNSPRSTC